MYKHSIDEYRNMFLNKQCNVSWEPLDRPIRKGESVSNSVLDTNVYEIYETCYGEILFKCDKLYTPFDVRRLNLPT